MTEPKDRGRPRGRTYPHSVHVRLREADLRRLAALTKRLELDQSNVIRIAIREKAEREGVE